MKRVLFSGLAAAAVTAVAITAGGGASVAAGAHTLAFTNQLDTIAPTDVAPAGPSAGDSFLVGSHIVAGAHGATGASCTLVTLSGAGIRQCEVDFLLRHGTITTRGLTDTAGTSVHLVVTGGTGRYAGMHGSGKLTPTPSGSTVVLRLH
jgi:hypothetical protein